MVKKRLLIVIDTILFLVDFTLGRVDGLVFMVLFLRGGFVVALRDLLVRMSRHVLRDIC